MPIEDDGVLPLWGVVPVEEDAWWHLAEHEGAHRLRLGQQTTEPWFAEFDFEIAEV